MFLFSRFFNEPIQNVENIKQLTMASEISTSQTNYFRDNRRKDRWDIKGAHESVARVDSLVPLMRHDPSDLGSLILLQITPKEPYRQ